MVTGDTARAPAFKFYIRSPKDCRKFDLKWFISPCAFQRQSYALCTYIRRSKLSYEDGSRNAAIKIISPRPSGVSLGSQAGPMRGSLGLLQAPTSPRCDFERKLYHCQRWFSNQRRQPTVASSYLLSGAANGLQRCLQAEKNLDFHEDVVMAEGREHNGRRLLGSERTATQLFWLDQRLDHLCGTDVYTYILSSILSQHWEIQTRKAKVQSASVYFQQVWRAISKTYLWARLYFHCVPSFFFTTSPSVNGTHQAGMACAVLY